MFTGNIWDSSGINPKGEVACTTAGIQIIVVLFAFTMFSFLQNRNSPLSNFWQWISHTVGCIPANKPAIASCFLRALTVFYSSTCNAQLSMFWQRISLPALLVLVDFWLREVWILSQIPLTPGRSQVIIWITHRVFGWDERLDKFHWAIQIFACVLTTQFADSVCSNYTICWPGRYSRCMQYNYLAVPLICMAAVYK